MKLTTFIKSYKIALANINDKVADWKDVYVGSILFPEKDEDTLQFVFSNGVLLVTECARCFEWETIGHSGDSEKSR